MNSIWPRHEGYTVFLSPDKKKAALVDMADEEVTMVLNREEKKLEYIHPVTLRGMKVLGISSENMEAILGKMEVKKSGEGDPVS